jgi:hypothetical protein
MDKEKIRDAIARNDWKYIAGTADHLRCRHGYTYEMTMRFFESLGGNRDDIEEAFYTADTAEAEQPHS